LRRSIKTFYHKYHVRHLAIIQQTTPEDGLVDNTVTAIIYLQRIIFLHSREISEILQVTLAFYTRTARRESKESTRDKTLDRQKKSHVTICRDAALNMLSSFLGGIRRHKRALMYNYQGQAGYSILQEGQCRQSSPGHEVHQALVLLDSIHVPQLARG